MGCFGTRKAIELRKERKHLKRELEARAKEREHLKQELEARANWERWYAEKERKRERQHELEMLNNSKPTDADRILTGVKWVCGTVAAVVIVPLAVANAGVAATIGAVSTVASLVINAS